MRKNELGFSAIETVLVLVIVGIIGFVGWYVWHAKQATDRVANDTAKAASPTTTNSGKSTTKQAPVTLQTYTNTDAGMTFKYPSNWVSKVNDEIKYDDGTFGGVSGTVTSPSGNKLTWVFQVVGGKGGECQPPADAVAFTASNTCASKQFISVEKVQTVKPTPSKKFRNMWEDALYITRTKYQASAKEPASFQICLDPYYTGISTSSRDETPQVGTIMGFLFPCAYWDTGFNATYTTKNEADFNSLDAKTAEQIMKTFNSI